MKENNIFIFLNLITIKIKLFGLENLKHNDKLVPKIKKRKGVTMKFFLDTADVIVIEKFVSTGIVDGVTTNPSLLCKQGKPPVIIIKKICAILSGKPVSVQVTEHDVDAVYKQAKKIASIAENVVVKIPCDIRYYNVIKKLAKEGVKINATLVFSVAQGICMCKLGVAYISPFIGRIDDIAECGMELVEDLRRALDLYKFKTEILAASIRSVDHVKESILAGADIGTVPPSIFEKMLHHPLTEEGMKRFNKDWKKLNIDMFP